MENPNMIFWNKVCKTNPAETKPVEYPFKHTAIGAQFQIKHATEQWGIFGIEWGVRDEKFNLIPIDTDEKCIMIYTATLFYPNGYIDIHADAVLYDRTKSGYKLNNDITKKVATDALTKGLSKLGFNSDVFEGLFDDNKYVDLLRKEFNASKEEKEKGDIEAVKKQLATCSTLSGVNSISESAGRKDWTKEERAELKQIFDKKRSELNV